MALTYAGWEAMRMGYARRVVSVGNDLTIGGGEVVPEVNYTLPPITITADTGERVKEQYTRIVEGLLARAADLAVPQLLLEFEHLPALTLQNELGTAITRRTAELLTRQFEEKGLRTALRVTVSDIRDMERPPRVRTGSFLIQMLTAFRDNARAGGHLLSIESTGGKEVHDAALLEANIPGILFSLGVLACRDMRALWKQIVEIAGETGALPAGDTACGFANTAMVLADRQYIPQVLAGVVRAMGAARSLCAYEVGAVGPSKDCAYEGPVLKALLGIPISMEGKAAACAHLSSVGNVAAAVCDAWSNESVQNVPLLSGPAPIAFLEILAYDCRLFNTALARGEAARLQTWLTESDLRGSVQAHLICPEGAFRLAKAIDSAGERDFQRVRAAALEACAIMRDGQERGTLTLSQRELSWLSRIEDALADCDTEDKATAAGMEEYGDRFVPAEYGL